MKNTILVLFFFCFFVSTMAHAEHSTSAKSYTFPGTTEDFHQVENDFTLTNDSLVYFSLTADVQPSSTFPKISYSLNFKTANPGESTCLAFGEKIDPLGSQIGPIALSAGTYSIRTTIDTTQSVNYTTRVDLYEQLLPGDNEPNNNERDEIQDEGVVESGHSINGHLGYGCNTTTASDIDYIKFKVDEGGEYYFKTTFDTMDTLEGPCELSFQVKEMRPYKTILVASPVTGILQGASGSSYDPISLKSASEMAPEGYYYWGVGLPICKNGSGEPWYGGGAYTITMQLTPPLTGDPTLEVNNVVVAPNTLFWGRDANVTTTITNNSGTPVNDVKLALTVHRTSNNELVGSKTYTENLAAYQQKNIQEDINVILSEGYSTKNLKEDRYMITAYVDHEPTGNESSALAFFDFKRDGFKIMGALMLMTKKKK